MSSASFHRLPAALAGWAKGNGLDGQEWQELEAATEVLGEDAFHVGELRLDPIPVSDEENFYCVGTLGTPSPPDAPEGTRHGMVVYYWVRHPKYGR